MAGLSEITGLLFFYNDSGHNFGSAPDMYSIFFASPFDITIQHRITDGLVFGMLITCFFVVQMCQVSITLKLVAG